MTIVVDVRSLTKRYRVFGSPLARLRAAVAPGSVRGGRDFTALEDVSFALEPGSALGVVGPNGAGKSTLLKVLGGIVEPTSGEVLIRGTVASIIELGAGFHPDFTGRQNALLNAEILGFTQAQALAAYDEIARFCELGQYLEMPVRTYSSGMFVRLAFAVAVSAHPDVLLVDEALAVGDAVFAHRCLARIREMRRTGVTIVFVSHDTNMILGLCDRAIYLDRGRLMSDGPPKDVVHAYLLNVAERLTAADGTDGNVTTFHAVGAVEREGGRDDKRFGSFQAVITSFGVENGEGHASEKLISGEPARFRMNVHFDTVVDDPIFGLLLKNRFGVEIFGTNTMLRKQATGRFEHDQTAEVVFDLPLHLGAGIYSASFAVHTVDGHYYDYHTDAAVFEVTGVVETIGLLNLPTEVTVTRGLAAETGAAELREKLYPDAPQALEPGPAELRFLAGDWYGAEREGDRWQRWMGRSAWAFVRVGEQADSVGVRFRAGHPDVATQPVHVSLRVDRSDEVQVDLNHTEWTTLEVPVASTMRGRVVKVLLTVDRTWVPSDWHNGEGGDPRTLGLMVARVEAKDGR